jgi:very-short-patch-repair endonuclease
VARSLAEALLFAALQADAKTSGLFRLNADGGFVFGNRTAEIDLLCRSLLIAIEVDGYFHFQDKEAYRRDRAKDWLMQRQGMAVLRFLAEDVTERLESIVERVIEVVQLRQAQRTAS